MKTPIIAACIALTAAFMADASAQAYKCVKDGKTTYQEQPCGGQAATRVQTSNRGRWVGCYVSKRETTEVRLDGSTLYTSMGKGGSYEERIIWAPASERQLRLMWESFSGDERDVIEVTSGLVMAGTAIDRVVKPLREDEILLGFWWIRGFEIDGDPMGQLPRTKETLRSSKEKLYVITHGVFERANKAQCAVNK